MSAWGNILWFLLGGFLTPPTITIEARMVTMPPITTGATPNTFCPIVLIALACTVLPIPNEAIAVNKAKSELACRCCAG